MWSTKFDLGFEGMRQVHSLSSTVEVKCLTVQVKSRRHVDQEDDSTE